MPTRWRLCGSPLRIGGSTSQSSAGCGSARDRSRRCRASLELVAGRVPLLLEVKVDGDIWRWVPALRARLAGYRGPLGVMSFDPRRAALRCKTNMLAQVRRGLVVRDQLAALEAPARQCGCADPHFLAVDVQAPRPALGRQHAAPAHARLQLDDPHRRRERAQATVQADAAHLGSRWPTAKPSSLRASRRASARFDCRGLGPARRAAIRSSATPSSRRWRNPAASAQAPAGRRRRSSSRTTAGTSSLPRRPI